VLGQLQLLIPHSPELCVLLLLPLFIGLSFLFALYLQSSRPVNRLFHFKLAPLLLLEQPVRLVLGLSDLLVQDLLLVVFQSTQLLNLSVNHLLSDHQRILRTALNSVHAHLVLYQFLPSELLNASLLLQLLLPEQLCSPDLVSVGFHNVSLDASCLFLSLKLADLLAF
jgi:hypothetical protein